jgi:serine/threonine protein kinase
MKIVTCPKCKSPNDDASLQGGWMTCSICDNRWFPSAATIDAIQTEEITQVRPPAVRPLTAGLPVRQLPLVDSGEYMPDEPGTGVNGNRALTERVDGRQSGMLPSLNQGVVAALNQRLAAAADIGHISPGKASPGVGSGPGRAPVARPVAHDPETGPTIDSDLFDRLEEDARYKRSEMKTIPEIVFDDPAKYRTSVPDSDQSTKVTCPVCGHTYVSPGTRHICPQCGTAYDEESSRIAAGPDSQDNLIGRTLRGCLIDRKLGEGGMGTVYHAKQLSLDRSVAVKVLPVDLARNKNFIQRFEREAKSLARINHPNILQIYDFGDDPQLGLYFMVIEYVDGLDLGEVLNRRGLLDQVEVLDLLRQSVMGLEAATEKNVIHRDIKPDNLMISTNGLVKVSDFGLAKGYVAQVGVTAAGVRVGTPAFMSPEQCDGVEVDFRSDIYNLGATAFLCLTGRLPFDGETPFAIMLKHKTEAVPSLCAIDPTIATKVDRLISRLLAKKPAERCDSLRQLIEDIESLESALAGTESVLRKSRGPFKALLGDGRESASRSRQVPADLPLLEQVEIVDLPPVAPAVASASPVRSPATSSRRAATPPRRLPVDLTIPPTPPDGMPSLSVAAPPAASSSGEGSRRASRRIDVELTQARERGRRNQLDLTIANGDRLAEAGQWMEAAREWQVAAEMPDVDPELEKDLLRRVARAQRRVGAGRLLRRCSVAVIVVGVAVAAAWAGTPPLHNWLADQWLRVRIDGLQTIPQNQQKVAALVDFVENNRQPWGWYTSAFHRAYVIDAAATAQLEIKRIESLPMPKPDGQTVDGPDSEVAAILLLSKNVTVPWETVAQRSGEVLSAARAQKRDGAQFDPLREAARLAESELTAQRADLEHINQVRAGGHAAQALALATAFRTRHLRAGAALARLPLPGRMRIVVSNLDLPADLALHVDGVAVPLQAAEEIEGNPAVEALICRNGDRETGIELTAEGYVSVRQVIPGSTVSAERLQLVVMKPAPAWSVIYATPSATATFVPWVQAHALAGSMLVQHRDGVLVLRPHDGAVVARRERETLNSPTFSRLWFPLTGSKMLMAQDNGVVQVVAASTLVPESTVHHGLGEALAWADLDLALQNGRHIHAAIERIPNPAPAPAGDHAPQATVNLVAQDGAKQYWRYAKLRSINQLPQLISHDDRLYVFDDATLHLLEEDGTLVKPYSLGSERIGAVVELPRPKATAREVLVPTASGMLRLQFGTHQDPVRLVNDPVFAQAGSSQVAVLDDLVLFANDRQVLLARFAASGTILWRQERTRPLGALPVLSAAHVAVADDVGMISIYARATGKPIQRITHGTPLAGAPVFLDLATGPGLMVCDRGGLAVAYRIRK